MDKEAEPFWRNFLTAVGAEVRPAKTIVGVSGLEHPVLAIGVDDARRRVIVVSDDKDARASAMMQADVQASMTESMRRSRR